MALEGFTWTMDEVVLVGDGDSPSLCVGQHQDIGRDDFYAHWDGRRGAHYELCGA
jgi:hypothetical protein